MKIFSTEWLKAQKRFLRLFIERISTKFAVWRNKNKIKIIVGSASIRQQGWISTDYPILDLTDEITFLELFKKPGSVNSFLAEHVWEHLTNPEAIKASFNCFNYLRKGGVLRIAVPDGYHPDKDYIDQVKPDGYGPGADDHQLLYTYETLSNLLESVGFTVKLLEWFDEKGDFQSEQWRIEDGFINRSTRFDERNKNNPIAYTSLIIDAIK